MKVTVTEGWILTAPEDERPHWVSHFVAPKANEELVTVTTDTGLQGIDIATSYTPIEAVRQAEKAGLDLDLRALTIGLNDLKQGKELRFPDLADLVER